jgi:hypothetical protein
MRSILLFRHRCAWLAIVTFTQARVGLAGYSEAILSDHGLQDQI